MRTQLARCVTMALALALIPVMVGAQGGTGPTEPLDESSHWCKTPGTRCLFGRATGCEVHCGAGIPLCISARCFLGFPIPAECTCEGGISA